ncbi:MAG TPA: hypothetical protein VFY99_04000 [Solirubrobacterales bacterium]
MAGNEPEQEQRLPASARRSMLLGAIAGATLVALPAALLGALIRELAHPAVILAFVLFGAVLGAYAWGVVAYERDHDVDEPSAGYRDGVLAEADLEPGPAADDSAEPGLRWLLRRRAASFLKLPLNPWI